MRNAFIMLAREGRHEFGDKTGSGMVLTSYVLSSNLQPCRFDSCCHHDKIKKHGENIKRKGL